ncbi:bi-domain-containing oxidoreductase [bacterium]|nr:bi-domain-containing oxidoreductase [bacterium]
MKQILQNLKTGVMELAELPAPVMQPGHVLIQTRKTVVSVGTEKMLVEFSKANLLQKARQQPEKVQQVLDKMRTDGLMPTLEAVFRKLDEPLPLGYCNSGVVLGVGAGVIDLQPGDRVASNGPHAEMVIVPRNLCVKIPDAISDEQAAFGVLGSIALQGVRLAEPTLGETFMVFGLGLLGLLSVQLLRASGCKVLAVDFDKERLALAGKYGATIVDLSGGADPVKAAEAVSTGKGIDGVIIAASAKSDDIVHQAAEACRPRGRIILVGVVGLQLRRSDFYKKELTFQVSCSYGPGRYDDKYEQGGQDYPHGFVRWTEQRNIEAILTAIADGHVNVNELITHRYNFKDAVQAYDNLKGGALGILLDYDSSPRVENTIETTVVHSEKIVGKVVAGVIGAGGFSKSVLIPALVKEGVQIKYVADLQSAASGYAARKFGIQKATTDYQQILKDPEVNTVFIVVGHHLHARFVVEALEAGKHVFVEKPLSINEEGLMQIEKAMNSHSQHLMVGYNRRFSPYAKKMTSLLASRTQPMTMIYTVNGGEIPADHWIQDPLRGGGRMIGEGCHFIDFLQCITGHAIENVQAMKIGQQAGLPIRDDKMTVNILFKDGSLGTLHYFANGSKKFSKERVEVFSDGRILVMDNFKSLTGYGFKGFKKMKTARQSKGHQQEIAAFVRAIDSSGVAPISFDIMASVTRATFKAVKQSN